MDDFEGAQSKGAEAGPLVGLAGASRFFRVSQGDEVDAASAQFFANSSLAPDLLFRRRLKSVADALKGIKPAWFYYGQIGCSFSVLGRGLSSGSLWAGSLPGALGTLDLPYLHGFYKWVFAALGVLNNFVMQVVVTRRDAGLRGWANWLREDLGSRPHAWLRPGGACMERFWFARESFVRVRDILLFSSFSARWLHIMFMWRSPH